MEQRIVFDLAGEVETGIKSSHTVDLAQGHIEIFGDILEHLGWQKP